MKQALPAHLRVALLKTTIVVDGVKLGTARDLLMTSPKRRTIARMVERANKRALRDAKTPESRERIRARIARTYRGKRLPPWLRPPKRRKTAKRKASKRRKSAKRRKASKRKR